MGLSRICEYRNQKGGLVVALGLPGIFHLLHSLGLVIRRQWLGRNGIPHRRLELDCNDGSDHALVLVKFKMGRSQLGMVERHKRGIEVVGNAVRLAMKQAIAGYH